MRDPVDYAEIQNDRGSNARDFARDELEKEIISVISSGGEFDGYNLDDVIDLADSDHLGSLINNSIDIKAKFLSKELDYMSTWVIESNIILLAEIIADAIEGEE